jgi:hypothetical protein
MRGGRRRASGRAEPEVSLRSGQRPGVPHSPFGLPTTAADATTTQISCGGKLGRTLSVHWPIDPQLWVASRVPILGRPD